MCTFQLFYTLEKKIKTQSQKFFSTRGKEPSEKAMTLALFKSETFEDPFREYLSILTAFSDFEPKEHVISGHNKNYLLDYREESL